MQKVKYTDIVTDDFVYICGLDSFLSTHFLVVAHDKTIFVHIPQLSPGVGYYRQDISLVFSSAYKRGVKGR